MALYKEITLENGITVSYHRIVTINKVTNQNNIVEIASYINEDERQKEKEAIENKTKMNIFIETEYITKEYNEEENIEEIYEYLKTTEKYKDAENV